MDEDMHADDEARRPEARPVDELLAEALEHLREHAPHLLAENLGKS